MSDKAKLFITGRSQAVRLPKAYRFEGEEVWIRKDPSNGDVVLSRRPPDWSELFDLDGSVDVPDDFMGEADRQQGPHDRDPFADVES